METIDTLNSIIGRQTLQNVFKELKFVRQRSSLSVLIATWRICVSEDNLSSYVNRDIAIKYPLGIVKGSMLWMEEVLNRFYFTSINSFVYLGAAILLLIIGVRRFNENVSDEIVIAGIIFEALMLLFMFIVMLFAPNEDLSLEIDGENSELKQISEEFGEIGRDFAATSVNFEKINDNLIKLIGIQEAISDKTESLLKKFDDSSKPNSDMIEYLKLTNDNLKSLSSSIIVLKDEMDSLKKEKISFEIKKELEHILSNKI